jgi:hypothetical protein
MQPITVFISENILSLAALKSYICSRITYFQRYSVLVLSRNFCNISEIKAIRVSSENNYLLKQPKAGIETSLVVTRPEEKD